MSSTTKQKKEMTLDLLESNLKKYPLTIERFGDQAIAVEFTYKSWPILLRISKDKKYIQLISGRLLNSKLKNMVKARLQNKEKYKLSTLVKFVTIHSCDIVHNFISCHKGNKSTTALIASGWYPIDEELKLPSVNLCLKSFASVTFHDFLQLLID